MLPFFQSVHGSPAAKGEILRNIVASAGFDPARVLMVGDARADWEGALAAHVRFLGRVPPSGNPFPPEVPVIPDLTQLGAFVHVA